MEFDLSWILLGLPLAFALGWLASRLDVRQMRAENRQAPKAYFRGLNLLLNEQQDEAIDAFIAAMQADPDTAELHFALGSLFRRRGEYVRAVRVHEHLLARADLSAADHDRARWALAQDFLKAGLLDRAEQALRALERSAFACEALLALLGIYERSRDWVQAADIARELQSRGQGDFSHRLAHYLCEQASATLAAIPSQAWAQADAHTQASAAAALALLQQARDTAPAAMRPRLAIAELAHRVGQHEAAWQALLELDAHAPQGLPLAVGLLVQVAHHTARQAQAIDLLRQRYASSAQLDLMQALVALNAPVDSPSHDLANTAAPTDAPAAEASPQQWYLHHLQREPSLVAAVQWLGAHAAHLPTTPAALPEAITRALEQATRPLQRYRCAACGFEARQHFWHCPGCQSWDSYPTRRVEEL